MCVASSATNYGDPDPTSAGTAGEAARWGGSIAVVGMAANPFGAHKAGCGFAGLRTFDPRMILKSRGAC